jgi:hypothetical protein
VALEIRRMRADEPAAAFLVWRPSRDDVGTARIERARSLSPGGLTLFTHQRNARARAFYEKCGFRVVRFGVSPQPESEPDVAYGWEPSDSSDRGDGSRAARVRP